MKKAIFISILILTTVFCKAQKADSTVTDSTAVVPIYRINNALSEIKKVMTIDQLNLYQFIIAQFQKEINEAIIDYKRKKK